MSFPSRGLHILTVVVVLSAVPFIIETIIAITSITVIIVTVPSTVVLLPLHISHELLKWLKVRHLRPKI